jgi:hypothetical protein
MMSTITNYRLIELIKSFVCISTILKIESYVLLDVKSYTSVLRCILIILTKSDFVILRAHFEFIKNSKEQFYKSAKLLRNNTILKNTVKLEIFCYVF